MSATLFHKLRRLSIRVGMPKTHETPPSTEDFEALVRRAQDQLPEEIGRIAADVPVRIVDVAPDELLRDLQIDDPFELTGLYEGSPLTEKSNLDQPQHPDVIWLFRRPILEEWIERDVVTLSDLVFHVYVHELAHHFGWADDEIEKIAPWRD